MIESDEGRDPRYPERNPDLPEIPGVEIRHDETYSDVHCWQAVRDGRVIAKSPWKKLTWKLAQAIVEGECNAS